MQTILGTEVQKGAIARWEQQASTWQYRGKHK